MGLRGAAGGPGGVRDADPSVGRRVRILRTRASSSRSLVHLAQARAESGSTARPKWRSVILIRAIRGRRGGDSTRGRSPARIQALGPTGVHQRRLGQTRTRSRPEPSASLSRRRVPSGSLPGDSPAISARIRSIESAGEGSRPRRSRAVRLRGSMRGSRGRDLWAEDAETGSNPSAPHTIGTQGGPPHGERGLISGARAST